MTATDRPSDDGVGDVGLDGVGDTLRALRTSEERYRMVLRNAPVVQWAIDRDGTFTLSEGRSLATLGLRPGEVVGRSVRDVYAAFPDIVADFEAALTGQTFSKVNVIGAAHFESRWAPLLDDAGRIVGVTGLAVDITERAQAEEARQRADARATVAERLAATGRLAAGVAHEVNNPLSYMLSNLDAALGRLRELGVEPDVIAALEDARSGAERVREIVADLRVLSRGHEGPGASDAAAVARSALALAGNELRHRTRVETRFEPAPAAALREPRLLQILVNLLLNAAQAIPEGRAAENLVQLTVRARGDEVELEVRDTGHGMTDEVRARIFDPFFSTKAVGEGMGLGLSLVHSIVTDAGGSIEVESEAGAGSTFRVRLPSVTPGRAAPLEATAPTSAAPSPPRRLRVMVVDDEPLVARGTARMLGGHDVEVVVGGREAERLLTTGERFDVILCDLMMPDVTGMDLHERLTRQAPDLAARMVFVTGGAFSDGARSFLERVRPPVLEKPFSANELSAVLSGVQPAG